MSKRAERRRQEKAIQKMMRRKYSFDEVNAMVTAARVETAELAIAVHGKTNDNEDKEVRANQFDLLYNRQMRMRFPLTNTLLDTSTVFREREMKEVEADGENEDGAIG